MADIDVGQNIGAKLDIDRAEAEKAVAQAKAEERKAKRAAARAKKQQLTA